MLVKSALAAKLLDKLNNLPELKLSDKPMELPVNHQKAIKGYEMIMWANKQTQGA